MKAAVRLGPIAHLRRAKGIGDISNTRHEREGTSPLSFIPGYLISPRMGGGWRVRLLDFSFKSHVEKITDFEHLTHSG